MKKLTFLFALLCASVMGWAATEKFVAANASIDHTYFRTLGWADETTASTCNWSNGELSVSMTEGKNDQWQAQVFLDTKITYDASKQYDISFDIITTNGVGGIMVKLGNTGTLYAETITTGASVEQHYSKANVAGVAANDGMLIFDFGYAPANTDVTISNISIVEKEAPANPWKDGICDYEAEHVASHSPDSRVLISLEPTANTNEYKMTVKTNSTKKLDYLYVTANGNSPYPAVSGTDDNGDAFDEMSVTFTNSNASTSFYIAWSNPNWGGRWDFNMNNVTFTDLVACSSSSADEEKPSMSAASVSVDSKTHNSVVLAISGATDNVAVTKYVVKNHSDNSAVGEYTPAEGKITVSALSPSTAYDWDIYAKDAAGNVSDNSKNITFTTDALVSNYCGETLINGDHSIALTCEMVGGKYRIIIEGTNLAGIGGSHYNPGTVPLNTKITSSSSTRIVCELDAEPSFYTPLYVNMPGEVSFTWPNDVVWGSCPAVAVTGVSLNHNELEMQVGGATQTLIATIAPANATNQNVTWESDDTSVATVENGVVTAVGAGSATITVTTVDGSFTDDCNVTVTVPSITAATYNGYGSAKGVYALYAITRNIDQSVTFSAKAEAAFGINKRIHYYKVGGGTDVWEDLAYNSVTGTYDYTAAAGSFVDGDEWVAEFYFPFAGDAASIVCNYTVGSEQAAPANIPVGAVVLNKASNTLSVGETDNLTATVYPSFATSASTVTWESDDTDVATVDAGTVTAVADGSANITASCGGVTSDPCAVTVAASLTEVKFYGVGTFTDYSDAKKAFAYEFCFTRATDHKVTLDVVFSEDVSGVIANDNDFGFYIGSDAHHLTYNANTKTASYNFGTQSENAEITYRFRFVMPGGLHETENTTYTVGSYNDKVYACVVTENSDNAAILEAYDGRTAQVIVDRSFTAGSLYTLVLPFSADAALTAEKLPGQLTKLNNTIVKDNGDLKVNFVDASAIEAGVPYLYVPSADVVNPVFAGVIVSKNLNPTEPADGKAAYHGIYAPTTGSALKAISNAYVLGSDQYLYAASGLNDDQQMKALRGYFVLNFPASQAPNRTARVIFNYNDAETATGIEGIQPSAVSCQKVIENGQLFIIRDGKMYNAQGQLIK